MINLATLTTQQKHVLRRLQKGYALIWTPTIRRARLWGPTGRNFPMGYVYAVTFDALQRRGVIERVEVIEGKCGLPTREVWRACA